MKIEYIAKFCWPNISGAARVTTEIAKGLAERGHQITVLIPNSDYEHMTGKGSVPAIPAGCNILYWGPRLSGFAASTISYLILLLKAVPLGFKSNVILGHYHHSNLAGFCAAVTSWVCRKPLVLRTDDVVAVPSTLMDTLLCFALRWCTWLSFRQAKLVLVSGNEQGDIIEKLYGLRPEKVVTSYNGVDCAEFNPGNRSEALRHKLGSEHIVVFSGELSFERGVDLLIRALALIKPSYHDIKVIVLGDGPDLSRLIDLATTLGVSESIEFIGPVNPWLVPTYLASSDVAIGPLRALPQTYGTTPLKIVEYMASGPVVITGAGTVSARLIVDNLNGLLFQSGDVEDLARAILEAFSDEHIAERLSRNARDTAKKFYEWKNIVSELEAKLRLVSNL